jgi:hypothetical protein
MVNRTWSRKVTLAKKAGAGELQSLKVPLGARGLMRWSGREWPIRCAGSTRVSGVKLFIFVGSSWKKKQVEATVRLTRKEALAVMKRASNS